MNTLDQNIILQSLHQSLVPAPSLVDGRTERERLAFFADFGSLINFYDHTNQVNGSWRPFILKDPVFLLAHISTTRFHSLQSLYENEVNNLSRLIDTNAETIQLVRIINHLFDQLTEVCMHIERWTYYMQHSFDYDLKKYVLREVKNTFSEYFWALLSFRDAIYKFAHQTGICPVDYVPFESFDEILWKQSRGLRPYWEVLQIDENLVSGEKAETENIRSCYSALHKAGEFIFQFLHTIVEHAPVEYERIKQIKSRYPDTTLIRTFEKLLRIYQDEQNTLSNKHLQFYYRDILKQTLQPAIADQVYLCAGLSGTKAVYSLAAGTAFDAGNDQQNNPILFISKEKASINPATILNAYTLAVGPVTKTTSSVYLQSIPNPAVISKDEQGKMIGWETFGGSDSANAEVINMGLILASPLLFLMEGDRTVTFHLFFNKEIDLDFIKGGSYFLSIQDDWLDVTQSIVFAQEITKAITLTISLPASQPAIVPFPKNTEGFPSVWPMLKISYDQFSDPSDPPIINELTIEVKVAKCKNFQLYNDSGALSPKSPFAPLGNLPTLNSNFIIGSAEIFSKPLESLYLEMEWDSSLPANFQTYYQAYNDYIQKLAIQTEVEQQAASTSNNTHADWLTSVGKIIGTLLNPAKKLIKLAGSLIGKLFSPPGKDFLAEFLSSEVHYSSPFNNVCFTIDFSMLDGHVWNPLNLLKLTKQTAANGNVSFSTYTSDAGCVPPAGGDILLFNTASSQTESCTLLNGSYFGIVSQDPSIPSTSRVFPLTPDPNIQRQVLTYSDKSETGFIKMTLTGPSYGFGASIYSSVVSDIAIQNALLISKTPKPTANDLLKPANLPYVPKIAGFVASYSASKTYVFNNAAEEYPLQCFLISPLAKGIIYDSNSEGSANNNIITSFPGADKTDSGIPLYPSVPYKGALFLQMDNVIGQSEFSLYFELARAYGKIPQGKNCQFSYLNSLGWSHLPLLNDGTNQFSCSGIVKLNLPADISNASSFMGVQKYWLSIGVTADPSVFSKTVFLKPNGICAIRSGNSFSSDTDAPVLVPGSITKLVTSIPQIASIVQPFASFGGVAAEDESRMNQRISNRLKTKDRAISSEDFYRLIRSAFPDIYYVKTVFDNKLKTTGIYLVKLVDDISVPNAYLPIITECMEADIQAFLQERTSPFSGVSVSNFEIQFLKIHADIEVDEGYQLEGVSKDINQGLNIFLSPWINSDQEQVIIDQGISDSQVAGFINSIEGVSMVNNIRFETWTVAGGDNEPISTDGLTVIKSANPNTLIVSGINHCIKISEDSLIAI